MQDNWCGEETPMVGPRHPSWEEEEEVEIGMWNNAPSQDMNQQGNWSYMKKMPPKVGKGMDAYQPSVTCLFNGVEPTRRQCIAHHQHLRKPRRTFTAGGLRTQSSRCS